MKTEELTKNFETDNVQNEMIQIHQKIKDKAKVSIVGNLGIWRTSGKVHHHKERNRRKC